MDALAFVIKGAPEPQGPTSNRSRRERRVFWQGRRVRAFKRAYFFIFDLVELTCIDLDPLGFG
jgi:hypothetical protein